MSEHIPVVEHSAAEETLAGVPSTGGEVNAPIITEENKNAFTIVRTADNNAFALEALGDRLIIQEDKFKTGYECKKCDGDGFLEEPCAGCGGKGMVSFDGNMHPCRHCRGERGILGLVEGAGKKTCPDCKGVGGIIVITQKSALRPTSGIVRSVGPDVSKCPDCKGSGMIVVQGAVMVVEILNTKQAQPVIMKCLTCKGEGKVGMKLKVGDRVIYAIFSGTAINFKQKGTCRIMHENEIMGKLYGVGNLGDIVK